MQFMHLMKSRLVQVGSLLPVSLWQAFSIGKVSICVKSYVRKLYLRSTLSGVSVVDYSLLRGCTPRKSIFCACIRGISLKRSWCLPTVPLFGAVALLGCIKMYPFLICRMKRFNEWGQCAVLNLLVSYSPETEEERFDILNILDDRLKSSSAAVVLVREL